ncbi:GNAT family N-acetyltransferase [Cryobacterium sp. Y82]|uniref:GNAT family N-acetyltransferase n=1 Tax=Cryobacterium sp. Y82 TaxID=2045017 RepID=UPI000CE34AB4|nr:GNAT family N-acetyltransferase [Cryobacterium sp. Y82]
MLTTALENPRQDDVLGLVQPNDDFALSLYPTESYHGLDIVALERPDVVFYVARDNGLALRTTAIVDRGDKIGGVKRMFVTDAARGAGVGRALLETVEAFAHTVNISLIQLETGLPPTAAIALYKRSGYEHIPRFGKYVDDPTSYCMEKRIQKQPTPTR